MWRYPDVSRGSAEHRIETYASESFVKEHETLLAGKDWEMLSDSVFASVSDTKTPQGVLCLVKMRENRLEDMLQQKNGLWLILRMCRIREIWEQCSGPVKVQESPV
ncbi:MAG: hypothetical protein V8R46_07145 [Eubacterium ramulus]